MDGDYSLLWPMRELEGQRVDDTLYNSSVELRYIRSEQVLAD